MSLNNEPCITRYFFNDLSPAELKHYPCMINLQRCNDICNAVDDLATKICVPNKTKSVNDSKSNRINNIDKRCFVWL